MAEGSAKTDPYKDKNVDNDVPMDTRITDLLEFAEKSKFCMMTTQTKDGLLASRCMALAGKEDNGATLVFSINGHSGKTDDLAASSSVNLAFLAPNGEWASISGTAEVTTDREAVRAHYSPTLKAWLGDLGDGKHDGGPEDPRIAVIKVRAKTAQYALARTGLLGRAYEVAKGTVTGDAAAVNLLRGVSETEFKEWAVAET